MPYTHDYTCGLDLCNSLQDENIGLSRTCDAATGCELAGMGGLIRREAAAKRETERRLGERWTAG